MGSCLGEVQGRECSKGTPRADVLRYLIARKGRGATVAEVEEATGRRGVEGLCAELKAMGLAEVSGSVWTAVSAGVARGA